MPEYAGILLIDKPAAMTSHDVGDVLRRRLGTRRIGHSGTLDPDATGLLIMLVGKATSLFSQFSQFDKTYEVTLTLGITTSTADAAGTVLAQHDVPAIGRAEMEKVLDKFRGQILQVPPMVSAKKVNGKKLYVLARQGVEVERQAQQLMIHELLLKDMNLPQVNFSVRCSKGTYVRTLCEDIGKAIGCGGHMSRLRRLAIGPYRLEEAVTLDEVRTMGQEALLERILKTKFQE